MESVWYCMNRMRTLAGILVLATLVANGQDIVPAKAGQGIVAIKNTYGESMSVIIYKDRDLRIKAEDFRLSGQSGNVRPYYLKPDYGICYFVCIEKTKDYFRILTNNKDEGYLKNDGDRFFKTWESLLINSTVERFDIEANPIRLKPGDNNPAISMGHLVKHDRLEVIDVVEVKGEHWINVRFSKSGNYPFDQESDLGTGWIRWKSGDKLLVKILPLC